MSVKRVLLWAGWAACTATLVVHLVIGHGAALALGLMTTGTALGVWLLVDRGLGRKVTRWDDFWDEAGRGGPVAVAAGVAIIAGTLVYGIAYLSTSNHELAKQGRAIEFEGPVRKDGVSGFYVGAIFHVRDVDGCDEKVEVELAAFRRAGTAKKVKAEEGFFAFFPPHVTDVGSDEIRTVGPRNGVPVAVRAEALLLDLADENRIERMVPKGIWSLSPVVARFEADLLEPRSANSCYLRLPQFPDVSAGPVAKQELGERRLESWTRVSTASGLDVNAEASSPPPHRDFNGLPVWKCERQRGACAGVAVIEKKSAQDNRDLNLLAMGLFLSLGSAALLEGILDGFRRTGRPPTSGV